MAVSEVATKLYNNYNVQTRSGKQTSEEYAKALADYAQNLRDKIENGETEPSYQIGGQSLTEKEWEKLLSKVDNSIATIKEAVKAEKAPYSHLAKDGVIEYNGVTFNCDYERNQITLGDVSNPKNCLNIPLSKGGSLVVNVDNLGDLANAIGMFSPEDIRRILEAIAQYNKAQEMQLEIDEDTNSIGDSAMAPLVSESILSTDQTESSEEKGKLYITWYNEDGIFCREQGQTEGYLWSIPLNGQDEYDKVSSFLSQYGQDENLQFAHDENFWKEFLADNLENRL